MFYYLSPVIKKVIDNGNIYGPDIAPGSSFVGSIGAGDMYIIATDAEQPGLTEITDLETECNNRGIDYNSVLQWRIGG